MASAVKETYAASSALTITLASLASDTNLLAGRESAAWDNTSNVYLDLYVSAKITAGTSPTVSTTIEVWSVAVLDDTPTWPDAFAGADANISATSRNVLFSAAVLIRAITVDATSNRVYSLRPTSIAKLYGDFLPLKGSIWVVHNTAVALNATGGNHVVSIKPIYATVG